MDVILKVVMLVKAKTFAVLTCASHLYHLPVAAEHTWKWEGERCRAVAQTWP